MNQTNSKPVRILAVALSTRGFGFAVMEGGKNLIACGTRGSKEDKNAQSLAKVEKLLAFYLPGVLVLQDVAAKGSRRAPRIRTLNDQVIKQARQRKVKIRLFSAQRVRTLLLGDPKGTKQQMAEALAECFPSELASRLPRKRKPWEGQDGRMDVFDAVGLAVAFRVKARMNSRHRLPIDKKSLLFAG